jgi:hypothetical protein
LYSPSARALVEEVAPGQVEFIPVAINAATPKIEHRLRLASAYYFINVLGRTQRFQWLEMPVDTGPIGGDGVQRFGVKDNYRLWKLRQIESGEPSIWHEEW